MQYKYVYATSLGTYFIVRFWHIELGFFAAKHVVFGLLDYWCDAVELAAVCVRVHDLIRCPTCCTPVHGPTDVDYVVHSSNNFCSEQNFISD